MTIALSHKTVLDLDSSNLFTNISSYPALLEAIKEFGGPHKTEEEKKAYYKRKGAAFEVFAEYWLKRFSGEANPLLGVKDVKQTSNDEFQVGFDFLASDLKGETVHVQVKHRPNHEFTRDDLGTFVSKADEDGIPASRRILFHSGQSNKPFHYSYSGGPKQMRVVARPVQEQLIDLPPAPAISGMISAPPSSRAPRSPLLHR